MNYEGCIIAESLRDTGVLSDVEITKTNVVPVTEQSETPWLEKWTMHIVSVPEDQAETVAQRISAAISTEHCTSWYADFGNDTHHYVIFAGRVFKLARDKAAEWDEMRAYAKSVGLPEHQML
jgi:hypothetical protein